MWEFLKRKQVVEPAVVSIPITTSEKSKGKIFIAERGSGMLPSFAFKKKEDDAESKQLTKEQTKWLLKFGLMSRPYPASSFILLRDRCPIASAAIDAIANDVSSTGWQLALKEGVKKSNSTDAERKELEAFLNEPNDEDSLKELISCCITDLETVGDFSLEVARNNAGRIGKIFHVPAHTCFRNKDMDRFVQKRGTKTVFFVPFGSDIIAESKTGEEKEVDREARANELIFKKLYNSSSDYYGRSPLLSVTGAIITSINAEEYNSNWFSNRGIPDYVILLEGDWDDDSVAKMSAYIGTELKGNENVGRTMVLQIPDKGKATFEPLESAKSQKEGSFRLYSQDLDDKILGVLKVPRCKVSIQRVGRISGTDTGQALRNYNDSTVEPLQNIVESIFNTKILPGFLGGESHFNLVLNNMHIDDFNEKVEGHTKLLERGCETPNEVRQKLSLGKEYPSGDKYYVASNLVEAGEPDDELNKELESEVEVEEED